MTPDEVTEVEKVAETVDDMENVPDPVCTTEREVQGETVLETVAVPHGLGDADADVVVDMVMLPEEQAEIDPDAVWETVPDAQNDAL